MKSQVDAILLVEQLTAGQSSNFELVITGGEVKQKLNGIELAIMAEAKAEKRSEMKRSLIRQVLHYSTGCKRYI